MTGLGSIADTVSFRICAPAILRSSPFHEIPETRSDQRAADNPFHQGQRSLVRIVASQVKKEKKRDNAADQEGDRKQHTVAKAFHAIHSLGRVDRYWI